MTDTSVIACDWPHHDGTHSGCNQCHGAGSVSPDMLFRFVLRGRDAMWRRRWDMSDGDIDCTDLSEDGFVSALLVAGCAVYTDKYQASRAGATP